MENIKTRVLLNLCCFAMKNFQSTLSIIQRVKALTNAHEHKIALIVLSSKNNQFILSLCYLLENNTVMIFVLVQFILCSFRKTQIFANKNLKKCTKVFDAFFIQNISLQRCKTVQFI